MQGIQCRHKVSRISGKSGNGLAHNAVDFAILTVAHQPAESSSLFLGSAGDTVIGVHADCIPFRIALNQLIKILFLRFV